MRDSGNEIVSDGADRGPKKYECIVCGAATYENGPCHECGSEPFDDGEVELNGEVVECRSADTETEMEEIDE